MKHFIQRDDVLVDDSVDQTASFVVEDNAMAPRVICGSTVYFEPLRTEVKCGDMVVARSQDGSYIVRFYMRASGLPLLVPENKACEAIALDREDMTIVGVVTAVRVPISALK